MLLDTTAQLPSRANSRLENMDNMVDLLSEEADVAVVVAAVFREVRRLETKGDGMVVTVDGDTAGDE